MKCFGWNEDRLLFEIGRRDKRLLIELLKCYPLVPVSHHTLTRSQSAEVDPVSQQMLAEAMEARQKEQKGRVGEWLQSKDRFVARGTNWRFELTREELEWLLQVLNDVRVGSWLILGCPDPDEGKPPVVALSDTRHVFLMEMSGYFECLLIEAIQGAG